MQLDLHNLMELLGVQNASSEEKTKILAEAEMAIIERVLFRCIEYVPADMQEKLESNKISSDDLLQLLQVYVPNLRQIITEETDKYLADLVELVNRV